MADKIIWAPWRSKFVLAEKEKGCIFCKRLKMKDSIKNLIVYRGEKVFVILNKFPYNSGHTLIVPNRHIGQIEKLSEQEATEFFYLTQKTVAIIKKVLKPNSLNLGMNLGRISGAGVPGHVHMHIVPRWRGDTNFMPVVGKTNVISVPLEPIYKALKSEFSKI
ncbi:MAG: HIT domain-containing protein [FCB group bacterium]|nr:HIT domain-containing protein [FCB group bacterium]